MEKYVCEKCKRIFKKIHKKHQVTSYRNASKETIKWNKEKIHKYSKYIRMCTQTYKDIYIYKHENIKIYRKHVEKYLCENVKEYIKNIKYKNM